jgi:hypothetical protein
MARPTLLHNREMHLAACSKLGVATVLPPVAEYRTGISMGVRNAVLWKWNLTRLLWLFGCPHGEHRELMDGF